MRPKKPETTRSRDLFRARLDQIIQPQARTGAACRPDRLGLYRRRDRPTLQRQGPARDPDTVRDRAVAAQTHLRLSDEGVCERWVYDPYFPFFTGEEFFQHEFPHERSDLSHLGKRLADRRELLLAESLRVAHASGALRSQDVKRVTVDTTVQPKNVSFPTDANAILSAIGYNFRRILSMAEGSLAPLHDRDPTPFDQPSPLIPAS
jgi:transposase, IS5 family